MRSKLMQFKRGGFTLIELVIAMAIFVALIFLLSTVAMSMTKTASETQNASNAQAILLDATSRTTRDISYASRILRSDPLTMKVETLENGKCRRSDWSIMPAVDDAGNPIMRDKDKDPTGTQQRKDLINTIEFYGGACPDDLLVTFADDNSLSDPNMTPRIEKHLVVRDFYVDPASPIIYEYFDENDLKITEPDTPKQFIKRVRFTYGTTTVDRANPLIITTSAIPYAGGNPTETTWATVVPVAPVLGATVEPLTVADQPAFVTPDPQYIALTWSNPTPAITTGFVMYRYADTNKDGQIEQTQILDSIDPNQVRLEDRDLPRGACARYQIFAVTSKGLSAGSNYRDLCMPVDTISNLEVRVTQCNVDSLSPTSNVTLAGVQPGTMDFTQTTNPIGQSTVTVSWDAVYAEPAAGVGYDIYMNDLLVAVVDGQGGGWDSQSRNVTPAPAGTRITWTPLVPLDRDDVYHVVPFDFMETNSGTVVKLEAYNVAQRPNLAGTPYGSWVDGITCSSPPTLRHAYTGGDQVVLTWTNSKQERGYRIYRSPMTQVSNKSVQAAYSPESYDWVHGPNMTETTGRDSDYAWSLVQELPPDTTTWTTSNPVGSKYIYKVVAWNRAGMFSDPLVTEAINPENWVGDDGGPSGSGVLVDHPGYMSRTVNTVYGRPTPSQPQCEVDMSNRTFNVAWDPGILYPEDARIDIYRSGSPDLSTQGRFVHQENQKWAGLGYYVNGNSTPNGGAVPSSNSNAGLDTATGAFNQNLNAVDANAPGFGPGTVGQGAKGGGYWIVPNSLTRWGDAYKFIFTTSNEAGRSDPREISCYMPMPTANVVPGTLNNGPGVATANESEYFNVPGLEAYQMNNYETRWDWASPNGSYGYSMNNNTFPNRPDYQNDGGYRYEVFFEPVNGPKPALNKEAVPGAPIDCTVDPINLGGFPGGRGGVTNLSIDTHSTVTHSNYVNNNGPGNQRAWDHNVWVYAVNLETGKRIMTSSTCFNGLYLPGRVGLGARPTVQTYGTDSDVPDYGSGTDRMMDNGNMYFEVLSDEYTDFDTITVKNKGAFWPNPRPNAANGSMIDGCFANQNPVASGLAYPPTNNLYCSNLALNPWNGINTWVPWEKGLNIYYSREQLVPAFPYWYEVTVKNTAGSTTFNTNQDHTFPPTVLLDADQGSDWQGKRLSWWNEGCNTPVDYSKQEQNLVWHHFKRAEEDLTDAVNLQCYSRFNGGPLALYGDVQYVNVDGLGAYPYDEHPVYRSYGTFQRGGQACLNGAKGLYCTATINPQRNNFATFARANLGPVGNQVLRGDDSNPSINAFARAEYIQFGSNERTFNRVYSTVPTTLSSWVEGAYPEGDKMYEYPGSDGATTMRYYGFWAERYLAVPDPGVGAWINCGTYNETCVYQPSYTNTTAGMQGGNSVQDCNRSRGVECWKHGVYSESSSTFTRMSDINKNPKPPVLPRPKCGPDSIPYKVCPPPKP